MEEMNPQNEVRTEEKAPWSRGKIIAVVVGAVALIALIVVLVLVLVKGTKPAQSAVEPTEGSHVDSSSIRKTVNYAYTDAALAEKYNDLIVAQCGDHVMTGRDLQLYYWNSVFSYLSTNSEYISYLGPDVSTPLASQNYGEDVTWEQHFVEAALELYLQTMSLYDDAIANGTQIAQEDQEILNSLADSIVQAAESNGFASPEDYLAESFGPGITTDDYVNFIRYRYYANARVGELSDSIEVSEAEVTAYYDANATSYASEGITKVDENMVNIRHILIQPTADEDADGDGTPDTISDEAWAEAEAKAQEVYDQWKTNPTEENFITLAGEASSDPGSASNGGLYENVYPGQMVAEFNDWCFDATRAPGDTDIVKTDYGYHIMYFVSTAEKAYWYATAESDCKYEAFDDLLEEVFSAAEMKINYKNIHIFDIITQSQSQSDAE